MGMGAPKQGSTLPPQGGKGGVRPTQPGFPQQPGQVPPQGGKGAVQPGQSQVPPQGGKGTSQQDYDRMMAQVSFAPGTTPPTYEEFVQNRLNPKPMPQVMPQKPGVPAQGGKTPFTPEQQAAFGPYINNRPMPQVQQPFNPRPYPGQGNDMIDLMPYGTPDSFGNLPPNFYGQQPPAQPQVQQRLSDMPQIQAAYGQPQVMPRPVPQVMPRQPTPKPAPMQPQGLAQMQQFLKQQQMLRGRR